MESRRSTGARQRATIETMNSNKQYISKHHGTTITNAHGLGHTRARGDFARTFLGYGCGHTACLVR